MHSAHHASLSLVITHHHMVNSGGGGGGGRVQRSPEPKIITSLPYSLPMRLLGGGTKSFSFYHFPFLFNLIFVFMTLSLYCHDRQRHGYFQRSRRRSPAWAPPKPRPPRSVGPHFPLPCPIVFSFFRFFVLVGWLAVKVQMMLFTRMLQCLVFHSILLACQSAL